MSRLALFTLLIGMFISSACTLGPDYQAPQHPHNDAWSSKTGQASDDAKQSTQWWMQLQDPLLNKLIEMAAHNNRDLAVALANTMQAKALRREASGGYYPTMDGSAGANRNRFSRQTGFGANTGMRNTFSAGLDASWELDLFGRTRRSIEAADAQLQAVSATHDAVLLSVIAETAATYFEVRGLQRKLANTQRNVELLKEVEEIAHIRFESGVTSELDLTRARGERESLAAEIPNIEADIAKRIYRISVLSGKAPEFHSKALHASKPLALPGDPVPLGLRSDILKRRPDVRQAERELAASSANIGVAKADLFPSFSLTGAIGTSARVFSDLLTPATTTGSLGALLGWPIFAGGMINARIDAAEAGNRAALASYEQAVLLALEDAEGALISYGKAWQHLKRLRQAKASVDQAAGIARLRYESGEENFLVILDAERAVITTSNNIIDAETAILTSLTQLYKALGGSWLSASDKNSAQK